MVAFFELVPGEGVDDNGCAGWRDESRSGSGSDANGSNDVRAAPGPPADPSRGPVSQAKQVLGQVA